jgi:hypothetical protein
VIGRRGDVRSPVAVQVGDDHLVGGLEVLLQDVYRPLVVRGSSILKPDHAIAAGPGRGRDVHVVVAVQVRDNGLESVRPANAIALVEMVHEMSASQ